jgi:hypothetical protein
MGTARRSEESTGGILAVMRRNFTTSFASNYPHFVAKVERKGRTEAELDEEIETPEDVGPLRFRS